MKTITDLKPGQVVTLYNSAYDQMIAGSLLVAKALQIPVKRVETNDSRLKTQDGKLWLATRYAPAPPDILGFRALALVFLFLAIWGFTTLVWPVAQAELSYRVAKFKAGPATEQVFAEEPAPTPTQIPVEQLQITGTKEFKIVISKIGVDSNIIPNVDPGNESQYQDELLKGVAHAKGSYLPGQGGPVFLFSHSTDGPWNVVQYNAQFYALRDLEPQDGILIYYNGKIFKYQITEKKVISPWDLQVIRTAGADLILSTCWPPGTSWQRLVVFGKLI